MANKLGSRLAQLRDQKDLSNEDLAKAMGIAVGTVTQILAGEVERPPDERLRGAAKLLGVSFESLLELIPRALREALPDEGIWGEADLREAAAGNFRHIMEVIQGKLRPRLGLAVGGDVIAHVVALFRESVVVNEGGKLLRYDYRRVGDKDVELSNSVEVVETFRPASGELREATRDPFIEAAKARGRRFRIRVIRAGLSGNRNFYPDQVLREAVPLFDKVRVFVKSDAEHLAGRGKDVRNLIGRLTEPAFVEGLTPDSGEIQATFEVLESAGEIAAKIREAHDRGMADLFGFSIDAKGRSRSGRINGQPMRAASKLSKVSSVDLIVEPGAGGEVIELIEALQEEDIDMKLRERMLKLIEAKRPDLHAKLDLEDEEAIDKAYREALAVDAASQAAEAAGAGGGAGVVTLDQVQGLVRMTEARAGGRAKIAASKLPELAKARLQQRFDGLESFTEAEVADAIKDEGEYLARFTESGHVVDLGDGRIDAGEQRSEKIVKMLDAFFDPANREVISFKECYVEITGDKRVTGQPRNCDQALMREALDSTSLADVLGDSITRRMIADYRSATDFDIWKRLAGTPVPVTDFRTQERTRWGGYGDLPAVAQSAPYTALASPGDEKATYAVTKRGGTESVTIEMIKNDDVGVIQRIPTRLSRAAKRTLSKFVLDFIRTNPVIFDALALFHASHNNLATAPLSAASLAAGRLSMKKQTEFGTADSIGVGPNTLWVPDDLEETSVDLFRRNTENDKNFIQSLVLEIVTVWYWTDANDWVLSTNPDDVPTIEIGFLDGNEEPELFVQDSPTQGSLFSNDQITWKIRHIYGGNVLDYRGLYKAQVV